ncbi:MAG TPA: hypothetical protein VG755_43850 [Nannocystaceae bacterium]|nr:hypothetical protein [Nannocystaceae bacterium]
MLLTAIGLALALVAGPPTLPPDRGGGVEPIAGEETSRVILRCDPADYEALSNELRARWPNAEILEYGTEAFDKVGGRPFVYLEVTGERLGDAPMSITLITSDGRAYLRRVTPKDAERTRVVAVASANLLAAVADEDVPPDREQAVVPLPTPEVPDAPPVEPPPDTTPKPPPKETPPPRETPKPPREKPVRPPLPPERDVWQLGLDPGAALAIGLTPRARRGPSFGGDLRVHARAPIGLAFGGELRLLLESEGGYRLVRTRVVPQVGWVGRIRRIEWAALVGPTFEPWRVLRDGNPQPLGSDRRKGRSMLYGAAVHGALGYRVRLRTAWPSSLRIGVHVDLAASARGTGRAANLLSQNRDPLFALGGLELGLGLDLALWFDLRPR